MTKQSGTLLLPCCRGNHVRRELIYVGCRTKMQQPFSILIAETGTIAFHSTFFSFSSLSLFLLSPMDTLLELADDYFLDSIYAKAFPEQLASNSTLQFPPTSPWARDSDLRICLSLAVLVTIGGWLFYMGFSTLSYYLIFDHETMKHPKFLKNQVRQEIECASKAIPGFACKISIFHVCVCFLAYINRIVLFLFLSVHGALVLG